MLRQAREAAGLACRAALLAGVLVLLGAGLAAGALGVVALLSLVISALSMPVVAGAVAAWAVLTTTLVVAMALGDWKIG